MPVRTLAYGLFQNVKLGKSRRILPRAADQSRVDVVNSSGGCIGMLAGRRGPARPSTGAMLLSSTVLATVSLGLLAAPQAANGPPAVWQSGTIDLRDAIAARWSVTLHVRSAARVLHRLDLTRLQPRPFHPKKDAAAQEEFKKIPEPCSGSLAGIS